mmetsp:Transcript_17234/g.42950  ORF Transcript_17234/g.42950 Transcript_17234/m.42950 type:complete len:82 (-) Transcript_17234:127-372(-)
MSDASQAVKGDSGEKHEEWRVEIDMSDPKLGCAFKPLPPSPFFSYIFVFSFVFTLSLPLLFYLLCLFLSFLFNTLRLYLFF